jgi:hypothetical protein
VRHAVELGLDLARVIGVTERECEEAIAAERPDEDIRGRVKDEFLGDFRAEGGMTREAGAGQAQEEGVSLGASFVESDLRECGKTVLKWRGGFAFLYSSEYHVVPLRQQRTPITDGLDEPGRSPKRIDGQKISDNRERWCGQEPGWV